MHNKELTPEEVKDLFQKRGQTFTQWAKENGYRVNEVYRVLNGQAKAKSSKPPKPEFIVGKRTQEIKNATTEITQKGATVATTKITAKDPITLPGNAYVTMIGQTSILNMQHAMDLYHAENDRYPRNYDEFMNEIIKANNIALPVLPEYQKYGYDEKEHKLVILEYEDLKNRPLGR